MSKFKAFDRNSQKYDEWFDKNKFIYESELQAVKELLPRSKNGVEVGVGTGSFCSPFAIKLGVDPSKEMGKIAQKRGIKVIEGVAESLPFTDSKFDFVLMVTTICFLDDIEKALKEANSVLKPNGFIIIGFIDAESPLGMFYDEHKNESKFYKQATSYSVKEVIRHMENAQFKDFTLRQTLFQSSEEIKNIEPVKEGYGEGSFIVVRGTKFVNIIIL
jgi:ubiquinone/menaquinone biosynthesis C-methylase UbiE